MRSDTHPEFNRVMRAHLNYLEHYPFFASAIILGGLKHPVRENISLFAMTVDGVVDKLQWFMVNSSADYAVVS